MVNSEEDKVFTKILYQKRVGYFAP